METTRRQPKPDTTAFRVRLSGVTRFRRCGVEFTLDNTPYTLDAKSLSDFQKVELLNTSTLEVEELSSSRSVKDSK
jgi:hypothetical protein